MGYPTFCFLALLGAVTGSAVSGSIVPLVCTAVALWAVHHGIFFVLGGQPAPLPRGGGGRGRGGHGRGGSGRRNNCRKGC